MAIQEMRIVLSAYRPKGQDNDPAEFLGCLAVGIDPYVLAPQSAPCAAVNLEIGNITIADYKELGTEEYEGFEKAVQQCLARFAQWLATVPSENIERLRTSEWKVWVIANLWMDQDQMDFHVLPALSSQLGRLGLELYILSNE